MKQIRTRFLVLCMALLLIFPLLSQPARASGEETAPYEGTPLFLVAMMDSNEEIAAVLNAFLVHDPETGGTYLLGSSVIYDLAQNDYTALLMGDDDFFTVAIPVGKTGGVSYLYTQGLENAPYLVLSEGSSKKAAAMYREVNADGITAPIQKNYDLSSGWKEGSNGFLTYTGHQVEVTCMIGAPMVCAEDSSVLGSITMDSDKNMMLAPVARGTLSTKYCIETLSGGSPSPDSSPSPDGSPSPEERSPEGSPSDGGSSSDGGGSTGSNQKSNSGYTWLAVIGAAAVFFWFRRNQTGKKQGEQKEGTIPLDQPLAVPEPDPPAEDLQTSAPAVRDMNGRIYRADSSGRLTFGRGSHNTIQIADAAVSGSHCVLYREDGRLYLMDTGSTNGTFFSQQEQLKPNVPYRIRRGMAFFLTSPSHSFVVIEE